ncbi:hypothetical protein BS50DRAFT_365063 [Corynespora cassiicola Philippines]|uniref:Uncharacterized protein n=1 Tax=Corynespora cassiicola Philippines TaxID=1448308 RepID=A0A2T2NSL2_CORCC|nr:hypothetical protein BS50DRAFT_365063 [Corynespora cassiicola Philippines]
MVVKLQSEAELKLAPREGHDAPPLTNALHPRLASCMADGCVSPLCTVVHARGRAIARHGGYNGPLHYTLLRPVGANSLRFCEHRRCATSASSFANAIALAKISPGGVHLVPPPSQPQKYCRAPSSLAGAQPQPRHSPWTFASAPASAENEWALCPNVWLLEKAHCRVECSFRPGNLPSHSFRSMVRVGLFWIWVHLSFRRDARSRDATWHGPYVGRSSPSLTHLSYAVMGCGGDMAILLSLESALYPTPPSQPSSFDEDMAL